jgi:hypothetical protein
MMADDSTLLSGVSELDVIPPQSQTLTEQRLKFWFQQADPDTRARFYSGRSNNLRRKPHFFAFLLQRQAVPVIV